MMTDSELEAILCVLRHIAAQLDILPSRLAVALAAERRGQVSEADREILDLLLRPLLAAVRESMWTQVDLYAHAQLHPDLLAALEAIEARGMNRKKLGRLLLRVQGLDLGGGTICWQRSNKDRVGALWQIQRL